MHSMRTSNAFYDMGSVWRASRITSERVIRPHDVMHDACHPMGWLRVEGSIRLQVSFAENSRGHPMGWYASCITSWGGYD